MIPAAAVSSRLWPVLLAVIAASVRVAAYLGLGPLPYAALPETNRWYFEALRDHLPEYLAFTTLKPPATYLVHAVMIGTVGAERSYELRAVLLVTFALGVMSTLLLFLTAVRLGAPRALAFAIALVSSLALVPFEVWKDGAHYDHHTVPLVALFAYAIVRLRQRRGTFDGLLAGGAGALLVAQSGSTLYVVPLAILTAAFWPPRRVNWRPGVVALILPLVVATPLVAHTAAEARTFGTGNQSGLVLMLFLHEATKHLDDPATRILAEVEMPEWYRWCYANATPPPGVRDPSWDVLARSSGICFPWTERDAPTWPFDLTPLYRRLIELNERDLASIVERDMSDARDRRYLYAGFSPELSPRWIGVYGQASTRVATATLVRHPEWAVPTFARIGAHYLRHGPLFPERLLRFPREGGMRTAPHPIALEPLLRLAALSFAVMTAIGYVTVNVVLALTLVTGVMRVLRRRGPPLPSAEVVALCVTVAALSGIFILAAWDVDRYFLQVTPLLVLVFGHVTARALSGVARISAARRVALR